MTGTLLVQHGHQTQIGWVTSPLKVRRVVQGILSLAVPTTNFVANT